MVQVLQKNLCSQGVFPLLQPSSITPFSFLPNSGHPTTLRVLHVVLDTRPMSILWNEVMQVILQVACWMSRVARRALHAVLGVGRWALGVGRWVLGAGFWALGTGCWARDKSRFCSDEHNGIKFIAKHAWLQFGAQMCIVPKCAFFGRIQPLL